MPRYRARILSSWDPDQAFAYLADFSNAAEWDPGVVRASAVSGDEVAPGGAYDLVVSNLGRELTLRYVVTSRDARRITFQAQTSRLESVDTITVAPSPGGSMVEYDASLRLKGVARLLTPLLAFVFHRIGERASRRLTQLLGEPVR
jgi:hypothetical protein